MCLFGLTFHEKFDWSNHSMIKCKFKKVNNWTTTTYAPMGAFDYTTNGVTFPIVVIFFRGCVSEMVVPSYFVIYYIYIPGTLGPCFQYWCSVYGICKWSDTLWPVGRVRLFADYTISLSSLCRLIWRHWTTKMLVRYMMPSVCLRLRQFSQLSLYSLYGAVCLQLTQLSCDDRENVYFILLSSSNRKYESLTIV